ncbi:hypothetical protein TIFTF001_035601 [Ficus carica]|uniref:Uncharacterized protein n=1 Tax=Ficus carica TaxID=3494 RepID=A0AA88JA92_FICCA|nr:hypothetical protein TIFTF001_035601 [Ficus carica]
MGTASKISTSRTHFWCPLLQTTFGFLKKCKKTYLKVAVDRKISGNNRSGDGLGFVPLDEWNSTKPTARKIELGLHRNLTWKFMVPKLS